MNADARVYEGETRTNIEIQMDLVQIEAHILLCASQELQNDRKVVFDSVKKEGNVSEIVSQELRGDRGLLRLQFRKMVLFSSKEYRI